MNKQQTLLIDGDILLYRFAHSNEYSVSWGEGVDSRIVNADEAQFDCAMFIQRMEEKLGTDDTVIIFSGKNNFRYSVLPSYKHNRVGLVKPELYSILKEYLIRNHTTKEKETLEGDDVMGILATRWPGHFIIATIDKDLQQIPGKHFNWNTDKQYTVTEEDANRYFYRQILTGDSCDGYTGIPGCGPKKAEKILAGYEGSEWGAILGAYEAAGLTETDALQQARVARILRASDYDFKKKEIILWQPK